MKIRLIQCRDENGPDAPKPRNFFQLLLGSEVKLGHKFGTERFSSELLAKPSSSWKDKDATRVG
eukprot:5487476-Pleurochrysis_carterae.AAC.1